MSGLCKQLDAFVDGELEPIDTENFRHHLTHCSQCAAKLQEALQIELLALNALSSQQPQRPEHAPRAFWRRGLLPLASAALAAAATWLFFLTGTPPPPLSEDWLAQAPYRRMEARVSYRPADRYRPYEPLRSGGSTPQALPLRQLAVLEERDDPMGIAAVHILHDNLSQATTLLDRQPPSPDRDNDLAVVALRRGALEEAHELLCRALAARPDHPQALWNRGLVLRELGLRHQAQAVFERIASLKEPGWSSEAQVLASTLQKQRADSGLARRATLSVLLERLSRPEAPLPLAEVRQQPELVRTALYEAVRSADTREHVMALRPLAVELDRLEGNTLLTSYLDTVAADDFVRRAPLARAYALLLKEQHPQPGLLREQLRSAGARDLQLGALLLAGDGEVDLNELSALAVASGEPRFRLMAEHQRARHESLEGHALEAERRLVAALRECRARLPRGACSVEE